MRHANPAICPVVRNPLAAGTVRECRLRTMRAEKCKTFIMCECAALGLGKRCGMDEWEDFSAAVTPVRHPPRSRSGYGGVAREADAGGCRKPHCRETIGNAHGFSGFQGNATPVGEGVLAGRGRDAAQVEAAVICLYANSVMPSRPWCVRTAAVADPQQRVREMCGVPVERDFGMLRRITQNKGWFAVGNLQ